MNSKRDLSIMTIAILTAGLLAATPSLAATVGAEKTATGGDSGHQRWAGGQAPAGKSGIMGKVTAISGSGLTVEGRKGMGTAAQAITYAVDASGATVFKDRVTSTLSSIAIGDEIQVQGAISGTNVVATTINDGKGGFRGGEGKPDGDWKGASSTAPAITGNGQPVIAGTVSASSNSVLTVTTKSGIQYSVDAASAKIVKGQATIALTDVAVGDSVVVQGATSGTSVVASSVIDQGNHAAATATTGAATTKQKIDFGVFGQIGSFFKRIFGF